MIRVYIIVFLSGGCRNRHRIRHRRCCRGCRCSFDPQRPAGCGRLSGLVVPYCEADSLEFPFRFHLQHCRHSGGCWSVFSARNPPATVDGIGRHGLVVGQCRVLVAPLKVVPQTDPPEIGDVRIPQIQGIQQTRRR